MAGRIDRAMASRDHGVYVARDADGTVVYVGRTYVPGKRIIDHKYGKSAHNGKRGGKHWYRPGTAIQWGLPLYDWDSAKQAEAAVIATLQPTGNLDRVAVRARKNPQLPLC